MSRNYITMLHMQNYCITRENIQIQHAFTTVNKKIKILNNIPINVQKKKKLYYCCAYANNMVLPCCLSKTAWFYHGKCKKKKHAITLILMQKYILLQIIFQKLYYLCAHAQNMVLLWKISKNNMVFP